MYTNIIIYNDIRTMSESIIVLLYKLLFSTG